MVALANVKVYVETKEEILDPVLLKPQQSYRDFFEANQDAQALWILRPDQREPFRVSWRQVLASPAQRNKKGNSGQGKKHLRQSKE